MEPATDSITDKACEVQVAPRRKDGSHLVACFPEQYEALLSEKVSRLKELLAWNKDVDVFESPRSHYRMRANFQMWHDDPKNRVPSGFYFSMFDSAAQDKKVPCEVKSFPRGTPIMSKLMTELMPVFLESSAIFENLFEIRFITTQTEDAILVLCYKKPLPENWNLAAEELSKRLNIKILGRARKVKVVAGGNGEETLIEKLTIKGVGYQYYQLDGAFSQPNAAVCEKMITWAMDRTADCKEEDLLELYCGGGTFTAPLASNFKSVLATEICKASVELAQKTFAMNNITNIKIGRVSSEEFSEAYSGSKQHFHCVGGSA